MNPYHHRPTRTWPRLSNAARFIIAALGCATSLHAAGQFVKIVDTGTLVPGGSFQDFGFGFPIGTDRFSSLGNAAISGNTVVFIGGTAFSSGQLAATGLFSAPAGGGALAELVTRRTWLPEYTGPKSGPTAPNNAGQGVFLDFNVGLTSLKDDRLVFVASTLPEFGKYERPGGVYSIRADGTGLSRVLWTKEPRPGSASGIHEPIWDVLAAQDRVLVLVGQPTTLLMQRGSTLDTLVDATTPIPGSAANYSLTALGQVAYPGGAAFVTFQSGGLGIWRKNDDDADFVPLRQSQISGGNGPFPIFTLNQLRADSPHAISFVGGSQGNAQVGIFTQHTSTEFLSRALTTVATTTTPVPIGGSGNFRSFGTIATDSRRVQVGASGPIYLETDVVFSARDATNQLALYAYTDDQVSSFGSNSSLRRVIGPGDSLNGKTVLATGISRDALADSRMAFQVRFTDQTEAIYTVPLQGLLPRSGVKVDTQVLDSIGDNWQSSNSGWGSTEAGTQSMLPRRGTRNGPAVASGEGMASPLTGGVKVGAYAYAEWDMVAKSSVQAIQRFVVLGNSPGQEVDVDLNFSFSGVLGISGQTVGSQAARVFVTAALYQGTGETLLFTGTLTLTYDNSRLVNLVRGGQYSIESDGDVLSALDPFGDGRTADGVSVLSVREFNGATQARVGETLAIGYLLVTTADGGHSADHGSAVADFAHTLEAMASTSTPGASLAMLHTLSAPIPEPGQYLLMLSSIALLLVRVGQIRRRSQVQASG